MGNEELNRIRDEIRICSLDSMVDEHSEVRLIDAFVDGLDIEAMGVKPASNIGRPSYDGRSLLKLYIYGLFNDIISSRELAECCEINIEVMWLMNELKPDHRTIADFRKNHPGLIEKATKAYIDFRLDNKETLR